MSAHLIHELLSAAVATPFAAFGMLAALGVPHARAAQLHGAGLLGVAPVALSPDGSTWSPGGATQRLLLGVEDGDGELIDIVALASHRRDEWALRTGDGWALGLDMLADVELARDRAVAEARSSLPGRGPGKAPRAVHLRICATPLDWLSRPKSFDGLDDPAICVLDWSAMALCTLRGLGERVVLNVDPAAKERLQAMLAYGGLPRVETVRAGVGLAA